MDKAKLKQDTWSGKKKIWMWFPGPSNQLKLSGIAVYCYRVYQDEYDDIPSILKICKATGLSKTAITNADRTLIEHGLIQSDRVVNKPPEGWFQKKRPETIEKLKAKGRHWRHYYTSWELFIKSPQTTKDKLTYAQAALLSYMWHCFGTDFQPRHGWSISYLATVLKCKWETIKDALLILESLGMLKHEVIIGGGLTLRLCNLEDTALRFFQDSEKRRAFRPPPCSIEFDKERSERAVVPSMTLSEEEVLAKVTEATHYQGEEAEDLASKLMETDRFQEGPLCQHK